MNFFSPVTAPQLPFVEEPNIWALTGDALDQPGAASNRALIEPVREEDEPVRGDAAAPVTLVLYGNYLCPRLAMVHRVFDDLAERYGGRLVRSVFRYLPMPDRYPSAQIAAEAAEVAAIRGKFWEMHQRLIAAPQLIEPGFMTWHAAAVGLEVKAFEREMSLGVHTRRALRHEPGARRAGIGQSPAVFVNGARCAADKHTLIHAVGSALAI
jgi:protein-disulfide isomerase